MKLDFLCEIFSNYEIERCEEHGAECICIKNSNFNEPIKVCYELDDYNTYTVYFATQHLHITECDDLIDTIAKFANASIAAIEFYDNERNRFGGQIETKRLENLTYDTLRTYFGYPHLDISHLTFRVYTWDKKYCFEGSFVKVAPNIVKIIIKNDVC